LDRLDDRLAACGKRAQATLALFLEQPPEVLFSPTPLALGPLA
jgi:hypothetical protein